MSSPFYLGSVDTPGVDPGETILWPTQPGRFFLGKPEQQMVELPSPMAEGYSANGSQGEVLHGFFGGGGAVTRFGSMMRAYTLPYLRLAGRDRQVVQAFYRRTIFGSPDASAGPWAYVPPEDINRLTLAQSMCGAVNGVVEGWVATVAPVYQPAIAAAITPCGVMQWLPGASNRALRANFDPANVDTPDPLRSMPYLGALPATFTFWVQQVPLSAAPVVKARLYGRMADGTLIGTATGSAVTGTTSGWQPVTVTIDPLQFAGAQYLTPAILSTDGDPMLISNPLCSYTDEVEDWETGAGVPRVVWPTSRDQTVNATLTSDITMQLVETIDQAA